MKRLFVIPAVAFAGLLYWATGKIVHADATLAQPTVIASAAKLRINAVNLNFNTQTALVDYSFTDNNGVERGGGNVTIPFPNPTPVALGNILQGVSRTLCGYSSGGIGQITPIAVATVVP